MALRFHPMLSLRQLAMLKIATIVCDDPEIKDLVKEQGCVSFVFPSKETLKYLQHLKVGQSWMWEELMIKVENKPNIKHYLVTDTPPFQKWEELVEEKISSFLLPQSLRPELLEMIRSVSIEIDKWIKDLSFLLDGSADIAYTSQCCFQWNSLGKIDRAATAKMLILNDKSNIDNLYFLALHYDLMNILENTHTYDDLLKVKNRNIEKMNFFDEHLESYGTDNARNCWETSVGEGDFLWSTQKTFPEMGVRCLNSILQSQRLSYQKLLFCLAEMSESERKMNFDASHFYILLFFLDWPLQNEFLDAAKLLLPHFTDDSFYAILIIILYERIMLGRKDFNYIRLLKEFWSLSSPQLKEFIKNVSIYKPLMFTINYPNEYTFPNETLIEKCSYYSNVLSYLYSGIKYLLMAGERQFASNLDFVVNTFYRCHNFFTFTQYQKENTRK